MDYLTDEGQLSDIKKIYQGIMNGICRKVDCTTIDIAEKNKLLKKSKIVI